MQHAGLPFEEIKKLNLAQLGVQYVWAFKAARDAARRDHGRRLANLHDTRVATQYQQADFKKYAKHLEQSFKKSGSGDPPKPTSDDKLAAGGIRIRNRKK